MRRLAIITLCALALPTGMGRASAEEIHGKVKSIDADKGTMVLSVGDADRTVAVKAEARVYGTVGKKARSREVEGGLKGIKEGARVTLNTESRDGKELATSVKVEKLAKGGAKAKGKKLARSDAKAKVKKLARADAKAKAKKTKKAKTTDN